MSHLNQIKRYIETTNVEPSEELVERVSNGIEGVLKWLEMLDNIDVKDKEPMFYVFDDASLTTREDKAHSHASLEEVLLNAPEKEEDVITLPKVVK